jgi:hypothetical protein
MHHERLFLDLTRGAAAGGGLESGKKDCDTSGPAWQGDHNRRGLARNDVKSHAGVASLKAYGTIGIFWRFESELCSLE